MRKVSLLLLCGWVGCAGSESNPGPGENPGETPPGEDPADPIPDAAPPAPQTVRFIVMGDVGTGSPDQYAVAAAIKDKCDADGCDFAILLGDNIYDDGVSGVDDPQWEDKFEGPYRNLDIPFYPVLGNHDYGGGATDLPGAGIEFQKGPIEVAYSQHSDKWTMPDTHYTLKFENVGFIMLDSNSILWDNTTNGDQEAWYPTALSELADTDWIFATGHHPYLSNGAHGNAGEYEALVIAGQVVPVSLPIADGKNFKEFMDDTLCGTVDFYMAGHDHNRQWINEPSALCGTELIVSGAGAKVKDLKEIGLGGGEYINDTHYQDADTEGFMWIEISGNTLTGQFLDKNGVMNYERVVTK